jgi:site-specific DNA recombinase
LATERKRAVVYCRVSTDKQEIDGESLDYQEDKCRRYAELHNVDVITVLKEVKSGFIHYSHRHQLPALRLAVGR